MENVGAKRTKINLSAVPINSANYTKALEIALQHDASSKVEQTIYCALLRFKMQLYQQHLFLQRESVPDNSRTQIHKWIF